MKLKQFASCFLALILLSITSCNDDNIRDDATVSKSELRNTAFAIKESKTIANLHAVSDYATTWNTGKTIKIKFIANDEGNDFAKQKVKEYAGEWTKYANIDFDFISATEDADIKIAFNYENSRIAWSYIGERATSVTNSSGKPSMNIPYYGDSDVNSKEFKTIVLRLFGHVLGLVYEHQGVNAEGSYDWDESKVLTYFRQEGWSDNDIYELINNTYSKRSTKFKNFDKESIMLLYFPSFLTNSGKASKLNSELSDMDIKYIETLYPGRDNTEKEIPTKMAVKHVINNSQYEYNAVKIGEYLWLDANLKGPIETPNVTQHQINRSLWVLGIDTLNYIVTPTDYHKYIGVFFANGSRLSQFKATTIVESHKSENVEKIWGLPKKEDFRQLFAMCINGKDSYFPNDVLMNLSYRVGEIPIAKRVLHNHWMHADNTNKYGFNLVYAGYRQHAGSDVWTNIENGRTIITNQSDVGQVFNMHVFPATDGFALLHDYPTTEQWHESYWWYPVRLSRKLTDEELGYKLYINTNQTDIKKLSLTDATPSGYQELGHGYLRGLYVHYILEGADRTMTVNDMKKQALSFTDVTKYGAPIIN